MTMTATVTSAQVAAAEEPGSLPVRTVESIRVSGAQVSEAARATAADRANAAIGRHVAEQASQGRLVDRKNVRAAAVAGGEVTWESGSRVDELRLDRHVVGEGTPDAGEIVELAVIGAEEETGAVLPTAVAGAGMGSSYNASGGSLHANYCQTWTVNGNSVTGCVEKWKPTNDYSTSRDYYAYNRWGTAAGKIVNWAPDWKTTKFDMRSRPRAGYETRTKGMSDYFPRDSSHLCNEGGSVSLGVGSLSFTVNLSNCSEKYPVPNATYKTMGLVYDAGAVFETRVIGNDYEQEVWTYQGYAAPSLGFYNYGKFCLGTYATCSGTTGTDGW